MSVNQAFQIYDCKTKKIREKISYSSSKATNETYLLTLKEEASKRHIQITCCCSNHVPMKVSNTKHPYLYPATRNKPHAIDCVRNPSYTPSAEYEKAWKYDEEKGLYVVQIEKPFPYKQSKKEGEGEKKEGKIYREVQIGGKKKGEVTIFGLSSKLNMMAWQNIVEGKKRLPEGIQDVMNHMWGASRQIQLSTKQDTLQNIYYETYMMKDGHSISKMEPKKDFLFVSMLYQPQFRDDMEKSMEMVGKKTYDVIYGKSAVWSNEVGFYVEDIDAFDEAIKKEPHSDTYLLMGFAYRASSYHHKKLTLGHYCLVPISKDGLFVESTYEKEIYENLYKEKRLFLKPYYTLEGYSDFIPDYVLIDTKKQVIGEIFGVENNPKYDERKKEKFEHIKKREFKERYYFTYHNMKKR